MRRFGMTMMLTLAACLLATSTGQAQEASVPPTTCADGSVGTCVGDLLDIQLGTIDEVESMLIDMESMGMFSFGLERIGLAAAGDHTQDDLFARIATLRNQHARAKAANDATTDVEFDEMMDQADQEKGKNCKFSDKVFVDSIRADNGDLDLASIGLSSIPTPSKFDNGKCDIFDAVDLDGNDVKINERKENMCEKVCQEKMVNGMPQRGKSKDRLVAGMVDAIGTANSARRSISAQRARISALAIVMADLRALQVSSPASVGADDPCDPGTPGPGPDLIAEQAFNITIQVLDAVIVAGNIITEVLKTIADIADKPCKQTAAGFNASAACIPFTVAFHISSGIFGVVGGSKNLVGDAKSIVATAAKIANASKADKAKACSKIIRDDFDGGGQCVDLVCDGGPDDGADCIDDIDCSDGAIVILQTDVSSLKTGQEQTNAELAAVRAELAFLKSLVEGNRDLLLTPFGRRDNRNR